MLTAPQMSSFEVRLDEKWMRKRSVHKVHEYFEDSFRLR